LPLFVYLYSDTQFLTVPRRRTSSADTPASTGADSGTPQTSQPDNKTDATTPTPSTKPSSTNPPSTKSSTKSSSSAKASSSSSAGGGGGGGGGGTGKEFEGEATFYAPGLGSCGTDATEKDYVAALSKILFDATGATNSNNNPYCGRKALVKAAKSKRRRWWKDGMTELERWERGKSRDERWSRRSIVSLSREELGIVMNKTDFNPPYPTITEPPDLDDEMIYKRQAGGGGVTITVVDRCPVCKQYDLDLSPAAFDIIGSQGDGRVAIKWRWLD
jgi:hypothetical protein